MQEPGNGDPPAAGYRHIMLRLPLPFWSGQLLNRIPIIDHPHSDYAHISGWVDVLFRGNDEKG